MSDQRSTWRRWLLAAGLVGIVASAARPAASAPVDLEGGAYGGTASGGWACGPDARVKYGGVGGEIRVRPGATKEEPEHGLAISLANAAEYRKFSLAGCGDQCSSTTPPTIPSDGVAYGAAAKGGYDWDWVGFRVGAHAYESWVDEKDHGPTWRVFPTGSLRVGRFEGLRGEVGLGAYDVPTLLRPGLYGGLAFVPERGWEIAAHGGLHQTFDGSGGARADLGVKLPLADDLQLGVGGALSEGVNVAVEPELRLMVIGRVW